MRNVFISLFAFLAVSTVTFADFIIPKIKTEIAEASFAQPKIKVSDGVEVKLGPWVDYNYYYNYSYIMHLNGQSYVEMTFNADEIDGNVALWFVHHSAMVNGHITYAPVSIVINGQVLEDHYVPNYGTWCYDTWNVTDYVKEGKNTIRITLANDAISQYWFNHIKFFTSDEEVPSYLRQY